MSTALSTQYQGASLWLWASLGILITAVAFEGSRKYGGFVLILTVFVMLAYANEKGRI